MSWNQGGGGGYGDDEGTTEFFVPSDQVGRIIGKGGSRISEIKYESGANINLVLGDGSLNVQLHLIGGKKHKKSAVGRKKGSSLQTNGGAEEEEDGNAR
ncbi:unnamed protein product [Cyprideis torosa]|uniref:Uncharacterized protein n=1 Tax=Cyprideis torosa TaxID=163714 RepID=A0A7R8W0K8_9CRUS|nr:unnamed protein product [Cyprideis torosa]CAG0879865.1 unnamed protein product [Cyprideis torosa]